MTPRRVLVVLDDCGPGDALFVNFCLTALRREWPAAKIDCLASVRAAPVIELMGIFDRVITSRVYEQRAGRRVTLVARKLFAAPGLLLRLAGRYDLAVTFYWGTLLLNVVAWAAAPRRSYGYANGAGLVRGGLGRYRPEGDAVDQAVQLMARVGVAAGAPAPAALVEPESAAPDLKEHLPFLGGPYAVLHLGSDWACQRWLPERWARIADHLALDIGLTPVFTGVEAEAKAVGDVLERMRAPATSLAGRTTVAALAAVIRGAELCVAVDSLAFELAQAAEVPAVVLAGQSRDAAASAPSAPTVVVNRTPARERTAILNCKLRFLQASRGGCLNFDCPMSQLRGIEVDDVTEAIERVLGSSAPRVVELRRR